ncbi:MAG TPA: glycosyltransferase family 4 protein [Steroidobacteraceae bacterium]|nr:glycosyltransferase family 4 protein [Steroidobacteraceae bacterium]
MRILFCDPVASSPYDERVMAERGLGGTEATVVRVAGELSKRHEVVVAQSARTSPETGGRVRYVPLDGEDMGVDATPDCVIAVRKPLLVTQAATRFPDARFVLWLHNWQRPELLYWRADLVRTRCRIVTVSDAHRRHTDSLVNGATARALATLTRTARRIPIERIYNPIDPQLRADATRFDPDKLIFFSAPYKGLAQILTTFREVRRAIPGLQLCIAGRDVATLRSDPTLSANALDQPGVTVLGRLPQREVLRHVRESLCVFYPQNRYPETFGLVLAEANAVGTPVLAHDFGSAREILGGAEQLVPATDVEQIVAKLMQWRLGKRPVLEPRRDFDLYAIAAAWERLLQIPSSESRDALALRD